MQSWAGPSLFAAANLLRSRSLANNFTTLFAPLLHRQKICISMISTDIRIYHEKDFRVCFRWMLMCMCHLTWISIFPRDTKGVLSSVRNKQPMKKSPWSFLKNWGADRAHTDWANKRKHGKHTHTPSRTVSAEKCLKRQGKYQTLIMCLHWLIQLDWSCFQPPSCSS